MSGCEEQVPHELWAAGSGPGVVSVPTELGTGWRAPTEQPWSLVLLTFFFFFLSRLKLFCLQSFGGSRSPQCQAAGQLPFPSLSYRDLRLPCAEGGGQLPIGFFKGHMQGWGGHLAESLQFRPPQAG